MANENEKINKSVKIKANLAMLQYLEWSPEKLTHQINQLEYRIASIQANDPESKYLDGLKDALFLMQLARGGGKII